MVVATLMFAVVPAAIVIAVVVSDGDTPSRPGSGYEGFDENADGPSLVRADRFGLALAKLKDRAGREGSLHTLRLAPNRVNAVVRRADGERALIGVARDLDVSELPAGRGERGISLNRIDPAVPERVARAAAERLYVDPDALSYMAVSPSPSARSGGQWSIFFERRGSHSLVVADLDGRNVRVPGG